MKIKKIIMNKFRGEPDLKKLKAAGLQVGKDFKYGRYCFFDPAHCFLISIGDNVTFSSRVHLLAHDASTKRFIGYAKIGRIEIGDFVFVGANTTILPGVAIGDHTIIGAGSVVTKNCESGSVYAGVPAKRLCSLDAYLGKTEDIESDRVFEEDYTIRGGISEEKKEEMRKCLSGGEIGLVR